MKQFNLEEYKKNPSRKVVTRDGKEVALFGSPSGNKEYPVKGMIEKNETVCTWTKTGVSYCNCHPQSDDLFFADEEELTEFEKALVDLVSGWCDSHIETPEEYIDKYSRKLLNLARKELIPIQDTMAYQEGVKEGRRLERQDIDKELDEAYKSRDEVVYLEGYDQGKEDALKAMPKFKKATENKEFDKHVLLFEDEERIVLTTELYKDEYYIELDDLKTLPKEEQS